MRIYGREENDLDTIIPYVPLEQVHIIADLEEIDNMINFFSEAKKEQNDNAETGKIVPSHMKDFVKLKSQKEETLDIVVTAFKKGLGGDGCEVYWR